MADSLSVPKIAAQPNAIPPAFFNVCFVLFVINATFFPTAYFSHWWIYDQNGQGIPTDFVNVWAAGRMVLDGHPALAWDWNLAEAGRARSVEAGFCRLFRLALSAAVPVRRHDPGVAALLRRLHWLGLGQHPALSCGDARDRRPQLRLRARDRVSDGDEQHAGRPERLSDRGADRRHALPDADAAGAGGHLSRPAHLQAAIRAAVSTGIDRGVRMDGVLQRSRHRHSARVRVLARFRHRELAGLLPLDADVLAGLPRRGQGDLVEAAEHAVNGALSRRRRDARLDLPVDRERRSCDRACPDVAQPECALLAEGRELWPSARC